MVKGSVQNFSISVKNSLNSEISLSIFLDQVLDKDDLNILFGNSEKIVILTETELNNKIMSKSGRKSNPLMLNFEQYE
jgi:hypothetical protein